MIPSSNTQTSIRKIKSGIKTLNIIIICLLVFQFISYYTVIRRSEIELDTPERSFSYYLGLNFWIIIAVILFLRVLSLRNKLTAFEKPNV